MARSNPICRLMETELPSITYQKKQLFRPTMADVDRAYNILNKHLFDDHLVKPNINVKRLTRAWGRCEWKNREQPSGSWCEISMHDKWYCTQWFISVLAHEMVHQWQWDCYRWAHIEYYGKDINYRSSGHGPSFFMWRDKFSEYGVPLKRTFSTSRWMRHQDLHKS